MSIYLLIGMVVLGAAILLVWVIDMWRKPVTQLSWGFCWFCSRALGDDAEIVRIAAHNYVPGCPYCASKQRKGAK